MQAHILILVPCSQAPMHLDELNSSNPVNYRLDVCRISQTWPLHNFTAISGSPAQQIFIVWLGLIEPPVGFQGSSAIEGSCKCSAYFRKASWSTSYYQYRQREIRRILSTSLWKSKVKKFAYSTQKAKNTNRNPRTTLWIWFMKQDRRTVTSISPWYYSSTRWLLWSRYIISRSNRPEPCAEPSATQSQWYW
jgi:hypothetical protein